MAKTTEDIQEIFGAEIDEISLVGSPANKKRIVLMKTVKKEVPLPGDDNPTGADDDDKVKGEFKEKMKELASLLSDASKLVSSLSSGDYGEPAEAGKAKAVPEEVVTEDVEETLRQKIQELESDNLKLKGEVATAQEGEAEAWKAVEAAHELVTANKEKED